MPGRIVQFGTSRFLQAHADLFVHEARQAGQDAGPITVVQTTAAAERAGRVAAFGRVEGFPVLLRGLENGAPVERKVQVTSVDQGLAVAQDWPALCRLFEHEVQAAISNTGEAGYKLAEGDEDAIRRGAIPASFPAKLLLLLLARWRAAAAPLTIYPCELVSRNGEVLRDLVLNLARQAGLPAEFIEWLRSRIIWAVTLVDRIVSAPIEPIGAVAEPYALWAIERQPGLVPPCEHPDILMVDDLEPYARQKLHILNLGHTVLAQCWIAERRRPDETVREILQDPAPRGLLERIYREEVIPGFAQRGLAEQARDYVAVTLERFANPFLDHRLADIAQNHALKIQLRIQGFLDWAPSAAPRPLLTALAHAAETETTI
jgi:tagaturonate reductase